MNTRISVSKVNLWFDAVLWKLWSELLSFEIVNFCPSAGLWIKNRKLTNHTTSSWSKYMQKGVILMQLLFSSAWHSRKLNIFMVVRRSSILSMGIFHPKPDELSIFGFWGRSFGLGNVFFEFLICVLFEFVIYLANISFINDTITWLNIIIFHLTVFWHGKTLKHCIF